MVLDDVFNPRPEQPLPEKPEDMALQASQLDARLASPIDRLAAVVADLVLIVPVIALIMTPFTFRAKEAQILGEEEWLEVVVFSGAFLAAVIWMIYQAVFTSFYGGSPGKLILRLRVVSVWSGKTPSFSEAFTRALVWVCEGAACGVPFLSVFSNLRRRPFHDRAADTQVIVLARERQVGPSTLPEMSLASGFQSACLAMATLVFSMNYVKFQGEQASTAAAALKREDEGRLCPEVREAIHESPARKSGSTRDRLEVALLLFNAEQLESECLEQEADFALWKNGPKALAYLAKGMVLGARSEMKSLEYLDQACREAHASGASVADADACRLATLVKSEREVEGDDADGDEVEEKQRAAQKEAEVEAILSGLDKDSQAYLVLAAAKRRMSAGDVERALDLLDGLHEVRRLGGFVARERAKALWRMGRKSESLAAMRSVIDMSEPRTRTETARWFCDRESDLGACGESGQVACSELKRSIERDPHSLIRADIAASYVRGERCLSEKPDWREMKDQVPHEDGKTFLESLALIDEGEVGEAVAKLRALVAGSGDAGPFTVEAKAKLIDLAKSVEDLAVERRAWEKAAQTAPGWQSIGRHLIAKLCALHSWDDAIAIGLKIVKADPSDRETYAMMVDAAQGAGKNQMAVGLMAQAPGRGPASRPSEKRRKAGP